VAAPRLMQAKIQDAAFSARGHGARSALRPRFPRLGDDEMAKIV
jgi:hypothetical protein